MDLQTLTARLNKLAGFDLSDEEACDLLNEGLRDLAASSGFPRKVWQFTTTAGQGEYVLPADFVQPERVTVGGRVFDPASEQDVVRVRAGELSLYAPGVWFVTGDRQRIGVWPVPDPTDVQVEYVFRPAALVLPSDVPSAIPEEFHPALVFYVASRYYGTVEDNPDLEQRFIDRYQEQVARLKSFGVAQAGGNKPFQVGIVGRTA